MKTVRKPAGKSSSDPSPEQIHQKCLLIQIGWSEQERLKRKGFSTALQRFLARWTPPEVPLTNTGVPGVWRKISERVDRTG